MVKGSLKEEDKRAGKGLLSKNSGTSFSMGFSIKNIILSGIEIYRHALSPYLGASCRFTPTCSAYSKEAIERYGVGKGIFLSIKRLLKCHPFHRGGDDLVK